MGSRHASATRRSVMALLRLTLRGAQLASFHSARFSYVAVLSLMEDGIIHWHDTTRIAEDRRSALLSRCVSSQSSCQQFCHRAMSGTLRGGGGGSNFGMNVNGHARAGFSRSMPNKNLPNCPVPRPCSYWNQGVCAQKGDHESANILWKHMCKRCWDPAHTERDCPLGSGGSNK
jgi:hypothetical protein